MKCRQISPETVRLNANLKTGKFSWCIFFSSSPHPSYQSTFPLLDYLQLQAFVSGCHEPLLTLSTYCTSQATCVQRYASGDTRRGQKRIVLGACQQARVGFWVRVLSISLSTLRSSSESDAAQSVLKKGTNRISLLQTRLPIPYSLTLCWFRKASVGPNGVCHNNEGPGFCKESHSYGTWQTSQYSTNVSAHIRIMPASSVLISFCFYSACETWLIQAQITPALFSLFFYS